MYITRSKSFSVGTLKSPNVAISEIEKEEKICFILQNRYWKNLK